MTEEAKKAAIEKGISTCFFMMVESNGSDMQTIASLLEKGIIKSHVSKIFSFEEIAQAHLHIESGHTVGKIIIVL